MSSISNLIKAHFRFFACKGPEGFFTVDVPKHPTRYFILSSDGVIYSADTIDLPYRFTGYTFKIHELESYKPDKYQGAHYDQPENIINWKNFDPSKITIACYDSLYEIDYENTPKLGWIQMKINEYPPIKKEIDRVQKELDSVQKEKKLQAEIKEQKRIAASKAYNESLRIEEESRYREKMSRYIRTALIIIGVFILLKIIVSIIK